MHKILVIRLYFPLDVLRVSDYIKPSSGATSQVVHRIWYTPVHADTAGCCVAIAVWYRQIPNATYSL